MEQSLLHIDSLSTGGSLDRLVLPNLFAALPNARVDAPIPADLNEIDAFESQPVETPADTFRTLPPLPALARASAPASGADSSEAAEDETPLSSVSVGSVFVTTDAGLGLDGLAGSAATVPLMPLSVSSLDVQVRTLNPTGDSMIVGTDGDDIILAGSGLDTVEGGAGDDLIKLGLENIPRTSGEEIADGGLGNDTIVGSDVGDRLDGSGGFDDIAGLAGDDSISGGNKADILRGGSGRDKMFGGKHDDTMRGGRDEDTVHGESGNDLLFGNQGNDAVIGDLGHDTLWGGEGDDYMLGGNGQDRLIGEAGDDLMSGGLKVDEFWFTKPDWGHDQITDFQDGAELLRMVGTGINDFSELTVTDTAGDALIEYDDSSILIIGGAGLIDADDFIF